MYCMSSLRVISEEKYLTFHFVYLNPRRHVRTLAFSEKQKYRNELLQMTLMNHLRQEITVKRLGNIDTYFGALLLETCNVLIRLMWTFMMSYHARMSCILII